MNHLTRLSAAAVVAAIVCLSPGAAAATSDQDGRADVYLQHWGLEAGAFDEADIIYDRHWGVAPVDPDIGAAKNGGVAPLPPPDTGRSLNDIGPLNEPATPVAPVEPADDTGVIVGWTAAGVAAISAAMAGGMFLRRRRGGRGKELPHPV